MNPASAQRPILFSGPMVRAILEGRKTQTRRVVASQPRAGGGCVRQTPDGRWLVEHWTQQPRDFANFGRVADIRCPYGKTGDRLWVRETWSHVVQPAGDAGIKPRSMNPRYPWELRYAADNVEPTGGRWRPSIHMPRWASRLTLAVESVRAERLQDLTEEDAKAEGVDPAPFCKAGRPVGLEHVEAFEDLWNSLNAKRGFGWQSNHWVWRIEFSIVEATEVAA